MSGTIAVGANPEPGTGYVPGPSTPPPKLTCTTVQQQYETGETTTQFDSNYESYFVRTVVTDNGQGGIGPSGSFGFVDYQDNTIILPGAFEPFVTETKWSSSEGSYNQKQVAQTFVPNSFKVSYLVDGEQQPTVTESVSIPYLQFRLLPYRRGAIMPGTLRFNFNGKEVSDRAGQGYLYWDDGTLVGQVDYASKDVYLTLWTPGSGTLTLTSCITTAGPWTCNSVSFTTEAAPLQPGSLTIQATAADGTLISVTADNDGFLNSAQTEGYVEQEAGFVVLRFGQRVLETSLTPEQREEPWYDPADIDAEGKIWVPIDVFPSSVRYSVVSYNYLPLDAEILGIDTVRLSPDGRVPIYRAGDVVYVLHTDTTAPLSPTVNVPFSVGRTRLAWVRAIDAEGLTISGDRYELDRASGQMMFTDLTGVALPITVRHTVGDLRQVRDVQVNGQLTLSRPLTHNYPAGESIIASCLIFGDRRARVSTVFDQASWDSTWQDTVKGSEATATLNLIDFPITVTNEGADTDRWVFRCTSAAAHQWELISEKRGLVWSGTYQPYSSGDPVDVAPINPRTRVDLGGGAFSEGAPYMVIPQRANGGGWSTGNVVRINTVGPIADFWIARSIQQSDEPLDPAAADGCEIYALGNIDRPNV